MSLLNTTWNFNTPIGGTIQFVLGGPSQHAGNVNIIWGQMNSVQGTWAESHDGKHFMVILSDFAAAPDGSYPPPFGIPTINSGQMDMIPVVLFGSHANGQASMFCSNTMTQCRPSGHTLASFTMSKQ